MSNYNPSYASPYVDRHGVIHNGMSNRSGGKKIATWTFTSKRRVRTEIEVRLEEYNKKMHFYAICPGIAGNKLTSSDINTLYELVFDAYYQKEILEDEIVWEDYLEIVVTGENATWHKSERGLNSGVGASLDLKVNTIKRGVDSEGNVWTIHNNNVLVPFPESKSIDEKTKDFYVDRRAGISYIKSTPENIAALEGLTNKLRELRYAMANLMSQENICTSIADLTKTKLLEA